MASVEPWLRGPLPDVHPLVMPVFFSFAQVREDLEKFTSALTDEQIWRTIDGATLGFHLKHIAGSIDRLATYLGGGQLSEQQLRALKSENEPGGSLGELLSNIASTTQDCERKLSALDPSTLYESRQVGRRGLPTTVIGLIVHIAEHTQRHLGQAITICKLLRHQV